MSDEDRAEVVYEPGVDGGWALRVDSFEGPAAAVVTTRILVADRLEIERLIAARVGEHLEAIDRVVFTFGGRRLHLRDGSRIEFRWEPMAIDWRCLDCGIDTDAIDEYYMLSDQVWEQANEDVDGHLCLGCVEHRLGRMLMASDFSGERINTTPHLRRSPRLAARLHGSADAAPTRDTTAPR